jgi:hypothetical protein
MRVLHIDTGRQMRGGQWQVLRLLTGARHEAKLLARTGSPLEFEARRAGVRVEPFGWTAVLRCARLADLVHAHDARAHTIALLAGVGLPSGGPLVVSRRVAFPVSAGVASRWKYSRPARYLAVSEFVKGRLIEAGVNTSRISVVYDGVPAMPPSTRLGQIVAPATDDPRKGSAVLREAARLGGFHVRFSNDLSSDLVNARLFVYLSDEEGLGSAALMAMASGVPVIASRVGGLPEAVCDGITGVLVRNDPSDVAAAVHCMMDEESKAARMGEAGRARWESLFTVERLVERTEAVYQEALAHPM